MGLTYRPKLGGVYRYAEIGRLMGLACETNRLELGGDNGYFLYLE